MSAALLKTAPAKGPSIVLFGLPSAGKSALLGALAQAGKTQPESLQSQLHDVTGKLAGLHQSAYESRLTRTSEEVAPYPVRVESADGRTADFTLIDCAGTIAADYIQGKKSLEGEGDLARMLSHADAIIFAVDASLPNDRLDQDFDMFRGFLDLMETARGKRTDVAGLPIHVVLTKCDLLAKTDDNFAQWMDHIAEKKKIVEQEFRKFLSRGGIASFGQLDLRVHATAVKRPAFNQPGRGKEPFGVAELFRSAWESAKRYREARQASWHRSVFAALVMFALVGVLATMAALLFVQQPDPDVKKLEDHVRLTLPNPLAPSKERLRGVNDARVDLLRSLVGDPFFGKLPASLQTQVRESVDEMRAYLVAKRRLQDSVRLPYLAKDELEITSFHNALNNFSLPENYAATWSDTWLVQRLTLLKGEYQKLDSAQAEEIAWLNGRVKAAKDLIIEGNKLDNKLLAGEKLTADELGTWEDAVDTHFSQPYRLHPDQPLQGMMKFSYDNLTLFQSVREARQSWETIKKDVRTVREKIKQRASKG